MTLHPSSVRRGLLLVVPVALALIVTLLLVDDNDVKRTLDISATEPTFTSLQQLVDAAEIVVVARAAEVRDGRNVAGGTSAQSAIRTQLVTLDVGDVLDGATDQHLTLEQEYTLADGTPITINGAAPMKQNDEALLFLVRSRDESAPYVAVMNTQSRYLVTGTQRDGLTAAGSDMLSAQLAELGPYDLRCAVLAAGDTGRRCD